MAFSLPAGFKTEVNEFAKQVREFEAAVDENDKRVKLRLALISACRLLSSIDLQQLQVRLDEIYGKSAATPDWQEKILGNEPHFAFFLENVEGGILDAIGIDADTRNRILHELKNLREPAATVNHRELWSGIVLSIASLRRDVCALKDKEIERAQQRAAHHKLVKTLCTVVIVANAVGSVVFPSATVLGLAASITIGGVSQRIPEPK